KFLLEVLGAAGAVWGNCDIFLLRTTEEGNRISRIYAVIIGCIFLIRYYWHTKHRFQTGGEFMLPKEHHRRTHRLEFAQIHASKFILQVLGGGGAVWGSAEVFTLRNAATTTEWRITSIVVGFIFLIRWMFQMSAYCLCFSELWADPTTFLSTALRFYDAFIVTFILEVLGAAGAVWGASEIATLRKPETNDTWRIIASVIGIIFLFRWMLYLRAFIRSENTSTIMVKNDDEVKDLDAEIGDLQLKESTSTEVSNDTAIVEGYPILNEAISAIEQTMPSMLRQPSGILDRQTPVKRPVTPAREMDVQPSGILHRQISLRNSPPPSPKYFSVSVNEQRATPSMLRQPSGVLDRQTPVKRPVTPTRETDMQPSIFRRQISEQKSPPVSPNRFLPSSPTRSMSF
ncbi:hypothetical protein ACHAWT_004898, partial [Skeletonema menzelii]